MTVASSDKPQRGRPAFISAPDGLACYRVSVTPHTITVAINAARATNSSGPSNIHINHNFRMSILPIENGSLAGRD